MHPVPKKASCLECGPSFEVLKVNMRPGAKSNRYGNRLISAISENIR